MWFSYFTTINAEWCNGSTTDSDSVCRGSNPFSVVVKILEVWLSLVERYVRDVEVACSNHVTSILPPHFMGVFHFLGVEKVGWLWLGLFSVCQILKFGISLLDNLFLFGKV